MTFFIENISSSNLVAWCSQETNKISIYDFENGQEYALFDGATYDNETCIYIQFFKQRLISIFGSINCKDNHSWTYVKEIPNTQYLVSLYHSASKYTNMVVFDISKKGRAKTIYTHETVFGGNIDKFLFKMSLIVDYNKL